MRLFPNGDKVFEVVSRYDYLRLQTEAEDYEPGDIMALIIPFLILHNISEDDIASLASSASLTGGAEQLISWLQYKGWKVFCITATYEQYAIHITHKMGIYTHNLACTPLPWGRLRLTLGEETLNLLQQTEEDILAMKPVTDDDRIKQSLDLFFEEKLPTTDLGELLKEIRPVGGRRKLAALNGFADKYGQPLASWVMVGGNLTDFSILGAVDAAGGLSIAFNASEGTITHAIIGLASTSISHLSEVLETWEKSQRKGVERLVKERERIGGSTDKSYLHWLSGRKDIDEIIEIHKKIRLLVRGETGKRG
jgi:energy-converting hydrogenase A subunit R